MIVGLLRACGILLPPGEAVAPPIKERKKGEKKMGECRVSPALPMITAVFVIFPLKRGMLKNYFSDISTMRG